MKKLPIFIAIIIALIVGFGSGWFGASRSSPPISDTITICDTIVDTIPYKLPVPVDSVVLRYETVKLPVIDNVDSNQPDTVIKVDSMYVEVPIVQKEYKDSAYQAWVSGYRVNLDSINVFQKTITETNTVYINSRPKRWGLGIQVGAGLAGQRKIEPYIGIGISYNILSW